MKNKIIIVLLILVIAIGVFIGCTSGFNLGKNYQTSKKLSIQFAENFELADIEVIAKEVFGDSLNNVEYMNEFKADAIITVKDASDEQIENLENKLKEKYTSFQNEEEIDQSHIHEIIQIMDVPAIKLYDLVGIYIKPLILTTLITLIVILILFYKEGIVKVLITGLCGAIGIPAVYVSAIAILRIPVNEITISVGLLIYMLSTIGVVIYLKSKK